MRIGVDIDGCICDDDNYRLAYIYKFCLEKGLKEPDLPYGYEFKATFWSNELEEAWRDEYFDNYMQNVPVRYGVNEVFEWLHNEGHEIYLITGRWPACQQNEKGAHVREETEKWLKKNNIYFDKIVYTGFPKVDYIKKENIDVMIEDFEETLSDCSKIWPTFCYDNRYNQNLVLDNMVRFFSWYDFYRKFHEIVLKDR